MSKDYKEPVYFHQGHQVLVELGTIMGNKLYMELQGDVERREQDYMRTLVMLKDLFYPPKEEESSRKGPRND